MAAGISRRQLGGLDADGLVDYFGDSTIGANTYSYSAFCNAEWSKDGQHLNDAGKAIMGHIEAQSSRNSSLHGAIGDRHARYSRHPAWALADVCFKG